MSTSPYLAFLGRSRSSQIHQAGLLMFCSGTLPLEKFREDFREAGCGLLGLAFTGLAHQHAWLFSQVTDLSVGVQRLVTAQTQSSLLSCVIHCLNQYPLICRSVMYHHVTRLCTPAGWLNNMEAGPSADEGQLFTTAPCDTSDGFALYTYGTAAACLFRPNVTDEFHKGRLICQSLNSHVITLKSKDEMHLPALLTDTTIFLGLTDEEAEGHFVWDDDHQEIDSVWKLEFWGVTEPNGELSEQCVAFHTNLYTFDVNCRWPREVLCERALI